MARLEGKCVGDCSRCELLARGDVEMVPCVLDQLFQRVQRMERDLENVKTANKVAFSGVTNEEKEMV